MSHIVTINTEIRDAEAVRAACRRLGLPPPVQGTAMLFSASAEGFAVQLLEARKKGYTVQEQTLPTGEIKLTIRVEGDAA